jgi:hypothetical protein
LIYENLKVAKGLDLNHLGKMLIYMGGILLLIGLAMLLLGKLPYIGRIPGDIVIRRTGFVLYIPLGSMIIISLLLTLIFSVFRRR